MDALPLRTIVSKAQQRAQQRAFADAVRRELAGAWLAVQPRRRMIRVRQVELLVVEVETDQPPSL